MNVANTASLTIVLFMLAAPLNSATLITPASNGNDVMWLFETLVFAEGSVPAIDAGSEDRQTLTLPVLAEPPNQWNWIESLTVSGTTSATFGICRDAAVQCDLSVAGEFEGITFVANEIGAWLHLPGDFKTDITLWLTEIEQNSAESIGQSRQNGDAPEPATLYLTAVAFGLAVARARSKLFRVRIKHGVPLCRSS